MLFITTFSIVIFLGYVSLRNTKTGSLFIQKLCAVLNRYGTKNHLLELLTAVNYGVAYKNSSVKTDSSMMEGGSSDEEVSSSSDAFTIKQKDGPGQGLIQMPNFFSTLTGLVYFKPKQNAEQSP